MNKANIQKIIDNLAKAWTDNRHDLSDFISDIESNELLELHKMGKLQLNMLLQEAIMKDIPKALEGLHKAIQEEVELVLDDHAQQYEELQEVKWQLEKRDEFIASLSKEQLAMFAKFSKSRVKKKTKAFNLPNRRYHY